MARKGSAVKRWYGDKAKPETRQASVPARPIVGLASVPAGVRFRCKDCRWISKQGGTCENPLPALNGVSVGADWCCDYFRHTGMKVHIK